MRFNRMAIVVCLALFSSSVLAQTGEGYSLRGTIIMAEGKVVEEGVLAIRGDIVSEVRPPSGSFDAIDTHSYILPGFIDLHNHITWNVFPRWRTYTLFANRYEWQQRADYKIALNTPRALLGKEHQDECDANEYAEIKALVGGATSIVGSLSPISGDIRCIEGLVRNRDSAEIVRCHREWFDGTGYPRGLKGEAIPLGARIVAVAETFEMLVAIAPTAGRTRSRSRARRSNAGPVVSSIRGL